jgi:hypothetical protein
MVDNGKIKMYLCRQPPTTVSQRVCLLMARKHKTPLLVGWYSVQAGKGRYDGYIIPIYQGLGENIPSCKKWMIYRTIQCFESTLYELSWWEMLCDGLLDLMYCDSCFCWHSNLVTILTGKLMALVIQWWQTYWWPVNIWSEMTIYIWLLRYSSWSNFNPEWLCTCLRNPSNLLVLTASRQYSTLYSVSTTQ